MGIAEILIILLICVIFFLPMIFFYLHLYRLLSKCKPENNNMEPGLVWLNFIPIFNLGWIFYTVIKIRDALKAEFKSRNLKSDDPEFAYSIGLAYCITFVCSIIPFIGILTAIASFILWIIYWVKTYKYSAQLD
tara:strand:- start:501 stop:902 length:402 start_codon:yes stop_codon:yes gene_type:complete